MITMPKCCVCHVRIPQDWAAIFANGAWMHEGECRQVWERRFYADRPTAAAPDAAALLQRGRDAGRIRQKSPSTTSRGA